MKTIKKLLDTAPNSGNTKVAKTAAKENPLGPVRLASLSLFPDIKVCPASELAGCIKPCLTWSGLAAVYDSINSARKARTHYWLTDQSGFLDQLRRELTNFSKLCRKQGVQGVVRLNVLSDIQFERFGIPQAFPELFFLDYTKLSKRLGKTPSNYKLIFSYSDRPEYAKHVKAAQQTDVPVAVVFKNGMPSEYLDRPVVDGDQSDILNVLAGRVVIGLKAKGPAKKDTGGFVVDGNLIAKVAA
tara:strand:+ start:38 stop:766 length:729 start_codon:yes stop_codon:yes gene_type:complete